MKRLLQLASLLLVAGLALAWSQPALPDTPEKAALKLFQSLTEEQKQLALKPYDDRERYKEEFPAVKRPGLPYSKLTKEQKQLIEEAIRTMTSEYGASRVLAVTKETPDGARYLNFFGDPLKDRKFAWRVAMHHLTLVYAEFGPDTPAEFGPVLLGGNPVKTLWDEEDKLFRTLFTALSTEEKKQVQGKGIQLGNLSEKARELATQLLAKRGEVFAPTYRKILEAQIAKDGGATALRLTIKGDGSKSHHEGGRYNWQIAGNHVFCNWVTAGNEHIHMTLRAKPRKA